MPLAGLFTYTRRGESLHSRFPIYNGTEISSAKASARYQIAAVCCHTVDQIFSYTSLECRRSHEPFVSTFKKLQEQTLSDSPPKLNCSVRFFRSKWRKHFYITFAANRQRIFAAEIIAIAVNCRSCDKKFLLASSSDVFAMGVYSDKLTRKINGAMCS